MINIIRSDDTANRLEAYKFNDLKVDPNRSGELFYSQFENELENFGSQRNLSDQLLSEHGYMGESASYSDVSVYSAGQENYAANNNYKSNDEQYGSVPTKENIQSDNSVAEANKRLDDFYNSLRANKQYTGGGSPAQAMIDKQVEVAATKVVPNVASQTSSNDRESGKIPVETLNSGKSQDANNDRSNNYVRTNTNSKAEAQGTKESANKKLDNAGDSKKSAVASTDEKTAKPLVNAENSLKMKKIQTIANIRSDELKAELAKLETGTAFIKFSSVKKSVSAEKTAKNNKKAKTEKINKDSGEKPELDAANISPKSDINAKTKRANVPENETKTIIKEKIVQKSDSQENIQVVETKSEKLVSKTETIKTAAKPTQTSTYENVRLADVAKTTLGIAKSIPADSIHSARLVLNPKSLGTVFVKISLESNKAKLSFKANSPEILRKLEEQLPGLKDKLAKVGISTNEFDFGLQSDDKESAGGRSRERSSYERYKDSKLRSEFISSLSDINNRIIRQDDAPSD